MRVRLLRIAIARPDQRGRLARLVARLFGLLFGHIEVIAWIGVSELQSWSMWIFFGRKTEVSRVEGGRSFRDKCPECGREARFSECVVEEKLSAYHILELGSDRETVFRCGECGELFRLRDQPGQAKAKRAPQAPAQAPRAAPAADPAAARRAREERERVAQQREAQVDAELAALKKKLGRE